MRAPSVRQGPLQGSEALMAGLTALAIDVSAHMKAFLTIVIRRERRRIWSKPSRGSNAPRPRRRAEDADVEAQENVSGVAGDEHGAQVGGRDVAPRGLIGRVGKGAKIISELNSPWGRVLDQPAVLAQPAAPVHLVGPRRAKNRSKLRHMLL